VRRMMLPVLGGISGWYNTILNTKSLLEQWNAVVNRRLGRAGKTVFASLLNTAVVSTALAKPARGGQMWMGHAT